MSNKLIQKTLESSVIDLSKIANYLKTQLEDFSVLNNVSLRRLKISSSNIFEDLKALDDLLSFNDKRLVEEDYAKYLHNIQFLLFINQKLIKQLKVIEETKIVSVENEHPVFIGPVIGDNAAIIFHVNQLNDLFDCMEKIRKLQCKLLFKMKDYKFIKDKWIIKGDDLPRGFFFNYKNLLLVNNNANMSVLYDFYFNEKINDLKKDEDILIDYLFQHEELLIKLLTVHSQSTSTLYEILNNKTYKEKNHLVIEKLINKIT